MRTPLNLLLALGAVSIVAFSAHGGAADAPHKAVPKIPLALKKPDLACTLMASAGEDGSRPITNGSDPVFVGTNQKLYIHPRPQNKGQANAEHFFTRMFVKNNGLIAGSLTHQEPLLKPGNVMAFPPVAIALKPGVNKIKATAEIDGMNTVAESDERNNKCAIEFTAHVKAAR